MFRFFSNMRFSRETFLAVLMVPRIGSVFASKKVGIPQTNLTKNAIMKTNGERAPEIYVPGFAPMALRRQMLENEAAIGEKSRNKEENDDEVNTNVINEDFQNGACPEIGFYLFADRRTVEFNRYDKNDLNEVVYRVDLCSNEFGLGNGCLPSEGVVIRHPEYLLEDGNPYPDSVVLDNDFALIILPSDVPSDVTDIVPLALNEDTNRPIAGEHLEVLGWGATETGRGSNIPLTATVDYITNEMCKEPAPYLYPADSITENMLCAASPGKDACQGDSGGPIIRRDDHNQTELVGVTSWGYGCALAEYPGVYARISAQFTWIRETSCNQAGELCPSMPGNKAGKGSSESLGGKGRKKGGHNVTWKVEALSMRWEIFEVSMSIDHGEGGLDESV